MSEGGRESGWESGWEAVRAGEWEGGKAGGKEGGRNQSYICQGPEHFSGCRLLAAPTADDASMVAAGSSTSAREAEIRGDGERASAVARGQARAQPAQGDFLHLERRQACNQQAAPAPCQPQGFLLLLFLLAAYRPPGISRQHPRGSAIRVCVCVRARARVSFDVCVYALAALADL